MKMKRFHQPQDIKVSISKEQLFRFGRNLTSDILGFLTYAIGVYTFASNTSFAPGGIVGIGVILNYLLKLPIGTVVLVCNIPVVLLSLRFLCKGYLLRTFQTLLISIFFLDILAPLFPRYAGSPLLAALFGGGISGLGLSIIYSAGSCTGGSDLIIMSLCKIRPHLSVGQITLVIDGSLILWGLLSTITSMLFCMAFCSHFPPYLSLTGT
jgi:uncharacterized membrane-anchored protein YitT (DUF2179 family)